MKKDERAKWRWEFLRRNKKYIEAFKKDQMKTRKEKYRRYWENSRNWGVCGVLPDPNEPYSQDNSLINMAVTGCRKTPFMETAAPILYFGMHTDPEGKDTEEPSKWVYRPNEQIEGWCGEIYKRKYKYWVVQKVISHKRVCEKLTMDNCPRTFTITFGVNPTLQKNEYMKEVMEVFNLVWNRIADAQKSLPQGKSLRSFKPRFSECQHYVDVYDLRTSNPSMSWSDIAIKIFPEEIIKNPAHKRKPRKEILPHPSAKDKVRKYWAQANKMINEELWRMF